MCFGAIVETEEGRFRDIIYAIDRATAIYNLYHTWMASYFEYDLIKLWIIKR